MSGWVQAIHDIFCRIINPSLGILALWLGLVLLKIEFIRRHLELTQFFSQNETIINLLFVFFTLYIMCQIGKWIFEKLLAYKNKHKVLKALDTLNRKEKKFLADAVSLNEKTIIGDINEPNLVSLVEKHILIKAPDGWLNERAYIINNFVWKKIKNDPRFKR